MDKRTIKELSERIFEAGKNNMADILFNEYFEELWGEYVRDK